MGVAASWRPSAWGRSALWRRICSTVCREPSMKFVRFESASPEETRAIGRHLAGVLPRQAVISLIGDLGAGKTTLTKGIVEGRGAAREEDVSSPTFTLIHEYGDPPAVYHVDLYRLDHAREA